MAVQVALPGESITQLKVVLETARAVKKFHISGSLQYSDGADQGLAVLPEAFVSLSRSVGGSVLASHPKSQDS